MREQKSKKNYIVLLKEAVDKLMLVLEEYIEMERLLREQSKTPLPLPPKGKEKKKRVETLTEMQKFRELLDDPEALWKAINSNRH